MATFIDSATIRRSFARPTPSGQVILVGMILAVYAGARILEVVHSPVPRTSIVALDVLSAMAFALVDGARRFGVRGILAFSGICLVVGNLAENLSMATGFPFGHYTFLELMGPKFFQVPVLLGLAYIGMSYVSWCVARTILGDIHPVFAGPRSMALPALAAMVMTAWDLAEDPVWSTVLHGWVWRDGGAWFGVPVSNYLGWLGTLFMIYLLFAFYLRWDQTRPPIPQDNRPQGALVFYALCAACNLLQMLPAAAPAVVQDPTGRLWSVSSITTASALVSAFVMGGFVLLALIRRTRSSSLTG
jgi:putative membrane protein